ncbi:MAG: DUF962 domain-containing protein [Candidatus Obscuribacterales bacterium]|nr:DUF962 domain-containing protein [Candidatus Obscuribacterales bacterium]
MSTLKELIRRALRAQIDYLSLYRAGHKTVGCRITHMIGIPMIMASLIAFTLYLIPILKVSAFIVKCAFSPTGMQHFHFFLHVALPNILQSVATTPSAVTNLMAGIALFTVGWFLQFLGHVAFEKNSPLFLNNPFNPLSYTTAVIFTAQEYGQLITRPFKRKK